MQNLYTYTGKQTVDIPYNHNFKVHTILLTTAILMLVVNRNVNYINVCLWLYVLFLGSYLISALLKRKIKNHKTCQSTTTWDFSDNSKLTICFSYDNENDYHVMPHFSVKEVYWCLDAQLYVFVYKTPGTFKYLVPFVVNTPFKYATELTKEMRTLYNINVTEITRDDLVSVLTVYPLDRTK